MSLDSDLREGLDLENDKDLVRYISNVLLRRENQKAGPHLWIQKKNNSMDVPTEIVVILGNQPRHLNLRVDFIKYLGNQPRHLNLRVDFI